MGRRNGNINTGAAVALLGALVFFIGFVGTVGSFLIVSAEGRGGGWTLFWGAMAWGIIQFIVGTVQAVKFRNEQARIEAEEEARPNRRRKPAKQAIGLPTYIFLGCGVLILGGLCTISIVMILIQNFWTDGTNAPKDGPPPPPPPPKIDTPPKPVEPVSEDLGPKEALTEILGGHFDATFKDEVPAGGMLIGLDVGLGKFSNLFVVRAVQPRYRTAKGEEEAGRKFGNDFSKIVAVKAKPGYAIGGINVKAGSLVNGLSITFMRVKGNVLDPADSYTSKWIGDETGGNGPTLLGGDGKLIVGIIGKRNVSGCNGLGLLKKL